MNKVKPSPFKGLFALFILITVFFSLASAQSNVEMPDVKLKFGEGLNIVAADSSMAVKIQSRFQSLYTSERSLADDGEWESDFLIRRARIKLSGWAVNPNLAYKVEFAFSNKDLVSINDFEETSEAPKIVLDAVVKWKFHKNFSLWVGQAKLPGNRERVVSSQKLQFVDRSVVNSIFNIDREMGVQFRSNFKLGGMIVKPMASFSFGEGRNTTITNIGGSNYTGRIEFLPTGKFSGKGDYFESDLKREQKPKIAFGVTYNYVVGSAKQKASGRFLVDANDRFFEQDLETFLVDMIFKYKGFSVLTEYAHKEVVNTPRNEIDFNFRESLVDANGRSYFTGQGFNAQVSYLFKNNFEVAARYTNVLPDTDVSFTGQKEYTLGFSKYIVGHSLKVQADVSLTDQEGIPDNNLRFRLQTEFAF